MAWLDRPLALWLDQTAYASAVFQASVAVLSLLKVAVILGAAAFVTVLVTYGRRPIRPAWVVAFTWTGVSTLVALGCAVVLKVVIGRSDVYPLFLRDHVYAFHPFALSHDYQQFPSTTMAGACAFVTGLPHDRNWVRFASVAAILLIAASILVTNSHWLADVVAGSVLGWAVSGWIQAKVSATKVDAA